MNNYVIKHRTQYVNSTQCGYTKFIRNAFIFRNKINAQNCCNRNEKVVPVSVIIKEK